MFDPSLALDFETEVVAAYKELEHARSGESEDEIAKLDKRFQKAISSTYGSLSAYERVKLSRHLARPFTSDYVNLFIDDFVEVHGDRAFGDDPAITGGLGQFNGRSVMVVGHQRGRSMEERVRRNFGMPQPEGNRKAQRLFKLAERFSLPLLLFVDTQGAYPGIEAESRGQAEAIAASLEVLSGLEVPIVSVVIGEGGSGGALALGICDRLLMLENATLSVITPEGCASILWGKEDPSIVAEKASEAATALKLTAKELSETGIVDEVIDEPAGGAHWDWKTVAGSLADSIETHLSELLKLPVDELLEKRFDKFRQIGAEHITS